MNKTIIVWVLLWVSGLVAGAGPAKGITLKLATIAPEGTTLTKALRSSSKEIEEKSGGKVRLKIYPGGLMGNDLVVLRKIRLGQLHGGTFTSGGLASVDGNYQILGMPMLLHNYAQVDLARKKYEPVITRGLEKKGFISTGMLEAGFIYMMSNQPVEKPADLKGQKVWAPEGDLISRVVFEKAGVHPIPLPLPDVLTGLQTNLIDTVSTSPVAAIVLQWFTKVRYLSETPLLYNYGTLAISNKVWRKIPKENQSMVLEVLKRELSKVNVQTREDNQAALQTLRKQGIQFVSITGANLLELQRIADEALATFRNKNVFDYQMLEQIRRTVAEAQ